MCGDNGGKRQTIVTLPLPPLPCCQLPSPEKARSSEGAIVTFFRLVVRRLHLVGVGTHRLYVHPEDFVAHQVARHGAVLLHVAFRQEATQP